VGFLLDLGDSFTNLRVTLRVAVVCVHSRRIGKVNLENEGNSSWHIHWLRADRTHLADNSRAIKKLLE
jgi:hypothetical protein